MPRRHGQPTPHASAAPSRYRHAVSSLPSETFGEIVRRHRLEAEFSQEDLASAVGVSRFTVGDWETNKTREPDRRTVAKVAEVLGIELVRLYQALGWLPADGAAPRRTLDPLPREFRDLARVWAALEGDDDGRDGLRLRVAHAVEWATLRVAVGSRSLTNVTEPDSNV